MQRGGRSQIIGTITPCAFAIETAAKKIEKKPKRTKKAGKIFACIEIFSSKVVEATADLGRAGSLL
jgi:hypothetical protein